MAALFFLLSAGMEGRFEGTWKSDDGAGSGDIRFLLDKNGDGPWKPTISFTVDGNEISCAVKEQKIEADKFHITCAFSTGDGDGLALLDGQLSEDTLTGKYESKLLPSGDTASTGTWTAARKK